MKKLFFVVALAISSLLCFGQDTTRRVIFKPVVSDTLALTDQVRGILADKMVLVCTQNGVEVGESRYVITPDVKVLEKRMTSSIPPKCIVELEVKLRVVDTLVHEKISETDITLTSIESNEAKAINKAISRMNVRSSQIRKFITVTRKKLEQ
ncbi:MAG: hypothetical protein II318_05660 [Bacteroidales bacterium]|nr:hypothetical protein [Bacteroidales bacterium]